VVPEPGTGSVVPYPTRVGVRVTVKPLPSFVKGTRFRSFFVFPYRVPGVTRFRVRT